MKYLEYSKEGLPKMITIQNPYSLLNRLFEVGSAEICKRENVGLLAYSPLGFGVLSGKYRNGQLSSRGEFKNGRMVGKWKFYNDGGTLNRVEEY